MTEYTFVDVEGRPYLYVDKHSSMEPEDISAAMGEGFREVMSFMEVNGVAPAGPALAVYYTYDPNQLDVRVGFFVDEKDLAKASGDIHADSTPAGRVLTLTHHGPYSGLRDTYRELNAWVEKHKLEYSAPTWEVYVNNPQVTPPEELQTDIYVTTT